MALGGKFDHDKYVKSTDDYQNYFHVDPVSGHIWLDGKNQPEPKEHCLAKQIINSISPSDLLHARNTRSKIHTDEGNIVDTNTANNTLYLGKAPNSQVITSQPINLTNHGRIDSNVQMPVTPITWNDVTDHYSVSTDSETSFGKNALEAKIYNETVDDVLADPKINKSIKEEMRTTCSVISSLKNFASPFLDTNKTTVIPMVLKLV